MIAQALDHRLVFVPSSPARGYRKAAKARPHPAAEVKLPVRVRMLIIVGASTGLWAGLLWAVFG